jgi:hypothetical protein
MNIFQFNTGYYRNNQEYRLYDEKECKQSSVVYFITIRLFFCTNDQMVNNTTFINVIARKTKADKVDGMAYAAIFIIVKK